MAGAVFAYRELGPQAGVPLVVLTHLRGLDKGGIRGKAVLSNS